MIISEDSHQNTVQTYNRSSPYISYIKEKWALTKPGSTKQTYHVSLGIEGSAVRFRPGDSIGILPSNDPLLVKRLLSLLSSPSDEDIQDPRSNETLSVEDYLTRKVNLTRVSSSLLTLLLEHTQQHDKRNLLHKLLQKENKELLLKFLYEKDLIDVLEELQERKFSIQELISHFAPLLPRFYSISSSQSTYPNEIHLTVALLSFSHRGEQRYGVASHFLCHLAQINQTQIPIYVQPAQHFHLPEDGNVNLIMVGPGTGIAPYRAFLQERKRSGATGKNWLFFGERSKQYDFFYQDYWEQLVRESQLKLTTAFSRDQEKKIYVQDRLYEEAEELWSWLQEGAYFYLCGNASHMAKDVEHTLLRIFQEQGRYSEEEAKAYFKSLKQAKRYLTDVY